MPDTPTQPRGAADSIVLASPLVLTRPRTCRVMLVVLAAIGSAGLTAPLSGCTTSNQLAEARNARATQLAPMTAVEVQAWAGWELRDQRTVAVNPD